jgi:hypothetical protein
LGDGSWELGDGSWELGVGSEELGAGSEELGVGSEELGVGSEELGVRSWEFGDRGDISAETLQLLPWDCVILPSTLYPLPSIPNLPDRHQPNPLAMLQHLL